MARNDRFCDVSVFFSVFFRAHPGMGDFVIFSGFFVFPVLRGVRILCRPVEIATKAEKNSPCTPCRGSLAQGSVLWRAIHCAGTLARILQIAGHFRENFGAQNLRPERPFTRVSTPSGPEIPKSLKKSLLGPPFPECLEKSRKT